MDVQEPRAKYKRLKRIEGFNHGRALNWSCFRNQGFLSSDETCERLVEAIRSAQSKHVFDLWAWCLMPTHVHLVIYPDPERRPPVSGILRSIKLPVAQRVIARAKRESPAMLGTLRDEQPSGEVSYRLWQRGGGYDRNLSTAEATWEMIEYVHMNPVRDGLCARAIDWPWSSAVTYHDGSMGKLAIQRERLPRLR